ncbi:MAG: hypothetical protein WC683_04100 [bacterium]
MKKRTAVDFVRDYPGLDGLGLKLKGWNPSAHGSLRVAEQEGKIKAIDGKWYVTSKSEEGSGA